MTAQHPIPALFQKAPAEPKTQTEIILAALQAGQRLTPIDAVALCQCWRLAARIHELRQAGHVIECDESQGYGVYTLKGTP